MIAEYMKIMEKRYNNSGRNTKTQYWLVVQTHDFMSVTFPSGCPVFLIFKGGAVNGFDSISRWSIFVGIITCKEKGKLYGARYIFGTEPSDEEVLIFVNGSMLAYFQHFAKCGVEVQEKQRPKI